MGGMGNCIVVSKTRLHRKQTGTWNKSGVYTQFIRQTGGYGSRDTALGITSSLLSTPRERESIFGFFWPFSLNLKLRL